MRWKAPPGAFTDTLAATISPELQPCASAHTLVEPCGRIRDCMIPLIEKSYHCRKYVALRTAATPQNCLKIRSTKPLRWSQLVIDPSFFCVEGIHGNPSISGLTGTVRCCLALSVLHYPSHTRVLPLATLTHCLQQMVACSAKRKPMTQYYSKRNRCGRAGEAAMHCMDDRTCGGHKIASWGPATSPWLEHELGLFASLTVFCFPSPHSIRSCYRGSVSLFSPALRR
jgi:hypothetical protein